jgi:predicted negative regulator of RcsB-dependent stress response
MIDETSKTARAAELFERGRILQAQGDYHGARACYEESLRLRDDEAANDALQEVLATIGPV